LKDVDRGDVVMVEFPFSDLSQTKKRPALVVQCDGNNGKLDDVILALITSNTTRVTCTDTQYLIPKDSDVWGKSGLLHESTVRCEHLMTLHRGMIERVLGALPRKAMRDVDDRLKVALDLP
jgi:mRNA interferase MazF